MYDEWLWAKPPATLDAAPERTDITVTKATTDDIKAWPARVSEEFPGGYEKIGPYLKSGTTIYRWKYVEPGRVLGTAYDGMAHVNGHWVWFPKSWRVLEQP
ncbi:hypothetical protein [Streptomyces sp. NPDC048269]|uniref:hypothetical protein n=1 Tax=Streptomyces sp. NPDC048269 TaxID=3155753 RepID=UPI0034442345